MFFTNEIKQQINAYPSGKIFSLNDLKFQNNKFANVAVILSNLTKEGKLVRIDKGAYYQPQKSSLGLGYLPVYQEEMLRYLTKKLDGYLTGLYIYNKMMLTEQTTKIITIASKEYFRTFSFQNLQVECVKSYFGDYLKIPERIYFCQILDAVKDINHISSATPQEVFERILEYHISKITKQINLEDLCFVASYYPPRVRKILSIMMLRLQQIELSNKLNDSILQTTKIKLPYFLDYEFAQ